MRARTLGVAAIALTIALGISCSDSLAKGTTTKKPVKHTSSSSSSGSSDQIVTKNPDGTVEVTDAPSGSSGGGGGGVAPGTKTIYYRHAPPGTIKYADGTVVTRNADGSVDVTDSDSQNPQIHWDRPPSSVGHPVARHRAKAKRHH